MPPYCFNVYNDDVALDDEGAELAEFRFVIAHAVESPLSLAGDRIAHGHLAAHHLIEIVGIEQEGFDTVRFDEVTDLRP